MWNIVKAQNYQTRGDNLVVYAFLLGLICPLLGILAEVDFDIEGLSGGVCVSLMGQVFPIIAGMFFVVMVPRICGWDAADKTINYEIMSGHSRGAVYFGRVIVSLTWSMAGGIVVLALPVLVVTAVSGWGDNMTAAGAFLHLVLALFPMLRLAAELVLLTFLLHNCYKGMLIGWVFFALSQMAEMIYQESTEKSLGLLLASSNLAKVLDFSSYKLEYIGGQDIPVYVTAINPWEAAGTILVSLLVGAACLAAGYVFFQKRDMT